MKPVSEFSTTRDELAALLADARQRIGSHAWLARHALEHVAHEDTGTAAAAITKAEHELSLCRRATHALLDYELLIEQLKGETT